jgi:hypothetical protein
MVGLTVDCGLLQTARRQVQNAADAGAVAAAMELYRGNTLKSATTVATTFIQTYNGLNDKAVTITVQTPKSGPYLNNTSYVEVIVSAPQSVYLMPILGAASTHTVTARAVAGIEQLTPEGVILLDPNANPGLSLAGMKSSLAVTGAVVVNSAGGGKDQYGNAVPGSGFAVSTNGDPTIMAGSVFVHGGVSDPSVFTNIVPGGPDPLFANVPLIVSNPLRDLPVPTPTTDRGVLIDDKHQFGAVSVSSNQVLNPGVYNDISISNATNVTFRPGIYILSPSPGSSGQGLNISGRETSITAIGVMFYLTGSDYLYPSAASPTDPGHFDLLDTPLDGPLPPTSGSFPSAPDPPAWPLNSRMSVAYASVSISGGSPFSIHLTALNDASSPFNGMLFYQRPRIGLINPDTSFAIGARANLTLNGIVYAQWAPLSMQGRGSITGNAQLLVGSMSLQGGDSININPTTRGTDFGIATRSTNFGTAKQVFLVD